MAGRAPICGVNPLTFRWLGVAGVELCAGDTTLVIDPYFTRAPLPNLLTGRRIRPNTALIERCLPRCSALLITHPHFDHLFDAAAVALHHQAVVYGSVNTCRLLAAAGLPASLYRQVVPGSQMTLGDFTVQVQPGDHGSTPLGQWLNAPLPRRLRAPLRLGDYHMDACYSFRIQAPGLTIQHGAQSSPADVLILSPDRPLQSLSALLLAVQPRQVIAIHWDDFFRPLSRSLRPLLRRPGRRWPPIQRIDLQAFRHQVQTILPECSVLLPELFESYPLNP